MTLPDDKDPSREQRRVLRFGWLTRLLWFGLAFLVLALIAPGIRLWRADPPTAPKSEQPAFRNSQKRPELSSIQRAQCEEMIAEGQKLGVIRRRPHPDRIDVERSLWMAMDRQAQRGLMLALRCAAHGNDGDGIAVAHDLRNGMRLAQASAAGVTFP